MNQNVTASFGLSLLTLLFFAVVLYQPDPPIGNHRESSPTIPPPSAKREPTPTAEPAVSQALTPEKAATKPSIVENPVARPSEPVVEAPRPRAAMTRVLEGETLEAFATRVYGREADPTALWKSNRDFLSSADQPLTPGSMLRTP